MGINESIYLSFNIDIILNIIKNIKPYTKILPMFTGIENSVINDITVPKKPKRDIINKNIMLKTLLFCGYTTCIVLFIFKPLSKEFNSR